MGFFRKNKNLENPIAPKKKKAKKIILTILGLFLVVVVAFVSYIYATGSKIFDNNNGASNLLGIITGDKNSTILNSRTNILVMGRGGENHPGGLLTDSIMLVSIEPTAKKIALMNIPRDLYVPIKGHGSSKINEAFADGYNDYNNKNCGGKNNTAACRGEAQKAGANLARQTVADVFGIPVQYYLSMDFQGFSKIIDEMGGVDLYVEKTISDPYYPDAQMKGYAPFTIKAGQQHLDGATALKFARSRETTSDFDRSKRQQLLLVALREKAASKGFLSNPKNILDMITVLGDHVRTDMSATDIRTVISVVKDVDKSNIINKILSTDANGPLVNDSSSGTYYIKPRKGNYDELKQIAQNIFSTTSATSDPVTIEIQNGSGVGGAATKLGETLKLKGYTITSVLSASSVSKSSVIYDYSKGTSQTAITYLKQQIKGASVVEKTGVTGNVDIVIVLGQDYSSTN